MQCALETPFIPVEIVEVVLDANSSTLLYIPLQYL